MRKIEAGEWGIVTRLAGCDREYIQEAIDRRHKLPEKFVGEVQVVHDNGHGTYFEIWSPELRTSAPFEPDEFESVEDFK